VGHRDIVPDATLALLRDPYGYISRRCERLGTDVFATRLMGRPVVCMRGEEAARLFYDETRMMRAGAAPRRLRRTLFGDGGVQGLDDEAHRRRKALFTRLASDEHTDRLTALARALWGERIARWERSGRVVLQDEVAELHCEAVCAWAGVPLAPGEVRARTRDMRLMIESPAAIGPLHVRGRLARRRAERWAGDLVRRTRCGTLDVDPGTALHAIAEHRDHDGRLLDEPTAAVELLNVIRPTVAVARYVVFAAMALTGQPGAREALRADPVGAPLAFAQEVRRVSPFFPIVAARARAEFSWRGQRFPRGRLVILDLHGTDNDARLWPQPDRFRPERFNGGEPDAFRLIPQGGGDVHRGHRCPGEPFTLALMTLAIEMLTNAMTYSVPPQDLRVGRRAPAGPASGFVITGIRRSG
jgi:fatty-acid peroxygenase